MHAKLRIRRFVRAVAQFSTVSALFIACISPAARAQVRAEDYPSPKPAFPEQTNAPAPSKPSPALKVDTVVSGLHSAWSLALLPNGKMLVTERTGGIRVAEMNGFVSASIDGLPDQKQVGAESLHDVVLDPDFAHNRMIYFTYFAPPPGETPGSWPLEYFYANVWKRTVAERLANPVGMERVARGRLSDDERHLENFQVLADGSNRRIVFAPDGTLFVTGPDRFRFYDAMYDGTDHETTDPKILHTYTGRTLRINKDGTIPKDNPFLNDSTAPPDTYDFGHRDPEGAAINPTTGKLWVIEHGPLGGDKISIIKPGGNYGWPNVSYGRRYNGDLIAGKGLTQAPGVEQPVYFWYPDIAPCALIFYTGDMFPEWKGNVLVGGMGAQAMIRLVLNADGTKVIAEERLLHDLHQRVRELEQAPDGSIYSLLDDGRLIHITRK
jgi:aldose sugar dehydrogenase